MRYVYAMRPTALIPCLLAPVLLAACGEPAPPAPLPVCELRGNFQQTVYTVIGRDRALDSLQLVVGRRERARCGG